MRVVPKSNARAIEFYELHAPTWQQDPGAIGLTAAEADEVAHLSAAARAAYDAHRQALLVARAATQTYEQAVARLRTSGSACIGRIRAAAAAAGDDRVYAAASLPPPASPAPIAAPGQPTRFAVELLPVGALRLAWDCKNPRGAAGTVYEVFRNDRAAEGGSDFRFLAVTGHKHFTDQTIPAGTPAVEYQVTAVRSTRRGQPARHWVNFGTSGAAQAAMQVSRPAA